MPWLSQPILTPHAPSLLSTYQPCAYMCISLNQHHFHTPSRRPRPPRLPSIKPHTHTMFIHLIVTTPICLLCGSELTPIKPWKTASRITTRDWEAVRLSAASVGSASAPRIQSLYLHHRGCYAAMAKFEAQLVSFVICIPDQNHFIWYFPGTMGEYFMIVQSQFKCT